VSASSASGLDHLDVTSRKVDHRGTDIECGIHRSA